LIDEEHHSGLDRARAIGVGRDEPSGGGVDDFCLERVEVGETA